MKKRGGLPFVFINAAMTADGKIAPQNRRFKPFGGKRDQEHLYELRASADAVMCGARTVNADPVTLDTGGPSYRRLRLRRGLAEHHLRIVVSGSGRVDPEAKIFRSGVSPVILLTTRGAPAARLDRLRAVAGEVKICGTEKINWPAALRWLHSRWKIKRLLCEGGGELNAALIRAGLVDEIHLTLCPLILGGSTAPTIADGQGVERLIDAKRFQLVSMKRAESALFLVYRRMERKESSAKT